MIIIIFDAEPEKINRYRTALTNSIGVIFYYLKCVEKLHSPIKTTEFFRYFPHRKTLIKTIYP